MCRLKLLFTSDTRCLCVSDPHLSADGCQSSSWRRKKSLRLGADISFPLQSNTSTGPEAGSETSLALQRHRVCFCVYLYFQGHCMISMMMLCDWLWLPSTPPLFLPLLPLLSLVFLFTSSCFRNIISWGGEKIRRRSGEYRLLLPRGFPQRLSRQIQSEAASVGSSEGRIEKSPSFFFLPPPSSSCDSFACFSHLARGPLVNETHLPWLSGNLPAL